MANNMANMAGRTATTSTTEKSPATGTVDNDHSNLSTRTIFSINHQPAQTTYHDDDASSYLVSEEGGTVDLNLISTLQYTKN
jgi:hypothetical protein